MVSQATEIRDLIETEWSLTGRLSKVPLDNMKEIVRFFDRDQVEGNEWPKAVVVRKINDEEKENSVEHPKYKEIRDVYEITLYYRVVDVQPISYSEALQDVEDMGTETQRILDTVFSPTMDNGIFWTVTKNWFKADHLDQAQPELRRTLTMSMTKIEADNPEVFEGYMGVLIFGSPGGPHTYTEAYNVQTTYGYSQSTEMINDTNTPVFFTGKFTGRLNADMYLSGTDIGNDVFDVNQIGEIISNGEVLEATLLQQYNDNDSPTGVLTVTTKVKVVSSVVVSFVEALMEIRLIADIIEYPTMSVA